MTLRPIKDLKFEIQNSKFLSVLLFFLLFNLSFAQTGARYLIITPDNFVSAVQPLADWKTKKGVLTKIVPLSVTGSSALQIKTYILNAYNNWQIKPEYILLAGNSSVVPAYSSSSDDYYADMTGTYRCELSIGRLPCQTIDQCRNIVTKILNFERTPFMVDSTWLLKGTTIVREDGSVSSDTIYWGNARYIHNFWRDYRYLQIDSFSKNRGHTSTDVNNAINNGRLFVVYRGQAVTNWWSPFAMTPENLTNGYKTPIVVSGTCQTMSLSDNSYLGNQFMNAGSITNSKGAVAFFGTTGVASAVAAQRGTVTKGFFKAIFDEKTFCLGDAAKRGKFLLDSIFNNQARYQEWNLFGDPELNIWTDIPLWITAVHDTAIFMRPQTFTVTVYQGTTPRSQVLVCIMMDTLIYQSAWTNSSGVASFNINPVTVGTMSVTVTGQNIIPYEKSVSVRNLYRDVGIDTMLAPGSSHPVNVTVFPTAKIKNYGDSLQRNFSVTCSIINGQGEVKYVNTQTISSLAPRDTIRVNFDAWIPLVAEQCIIKMRTNLAGDQIPVNDAKIRLIQITTLFITQGFNTTQFPPPGWQNVIIQGSYNWERKTENTNPDCTPYEGDGMASYPSYTAPPGSMARLISPPISVGPSPVKCTLKFFMYQDDQYQASSDIDSVKVEYSTNNTDFYRVASFRRYEPINGWQEHSVMLGPFFGTIYFSFLALSELGGNMNIDYVRLYAPTAITEQAELNPLKSHCLTTLHNIKPNPINNGLAHISFTISEPSRVSLKIYDASGKIVRSLVNEYMNSGVYSVNWNGKDESRHKVAQGIYFCTLETPKQSFTKKLIFTR